MDDGNWSPERDQDDDTTRLVEWRPTGMVICPGLSWDEWLERAWQPAAQTGKSINWAIGDALLYAEDNFPDQWSQVLDAQYAEQHRGALRVSRLIPPEHRREELSWSCHREAAAAPTIEARAELLDLAETNHWGAREVAEEVAQRFPKRARRPRQAEGDNMGPKVEDEPPLPLNANDDAPVEEGAPPPVEMPRSILHLPALRKAGEPRPGSEAIEPPPAGVMRDFSNLPTEGAEAIRRLIDEARGIANAVALGTYDEVEAVTLGGAICRALGRDDLGCVVVCADQAERVIPDLWTVHRISAGERIFGGRKWEVDLRLGHTRRAIGSGPALSCAILDAALAAVLSDLGG